ncbi:hypothetical protein IE81DRAFT_349108 [Ceraceosorus guamensis]|uniref:Transcription factor IIIC subunit 5 HTH domain-containing protein n=1 Tax=Ceraceosorus guamensis TaxID=1522189 RepID=A0A316VSI4_9BASI|nr:hypothetical protein IE81DRAFT_349108 [Ceraceosorus guamensis]PWN40557.1 hypothetical protein IE81DRAFT_349108 [Ceraceosorus guamensis]
MSELQNGPADSYDETRQERVDGKVPEAERMAPVDRLPRQPVFLSVEYPGLLKPVLDRTAVIKKLQELEQMEVVCSEEDQSENGTPHPSLGWRARAIREARLEAANGTLNRALRTLCPIPEPYATAQLALNHMSGCVSHDSSVLECRLPTSTSTHRPDPRELSGRSADEKVGIDVYRHPFTGEFRDTNNIAIKVTTRRWIKKRRTENGEALRARSSAQPSASDVVQAEERLEYKVDILGVIKKTVRYRTLADFAYMPRVEAPDDFARNALTEYNETPQATSTITTARQQTALEEQASMLRQFRPQEEESDVSMRQTSSLSLLDSLLRLDIDAIRQYRIAPEMEDYDVPVEGGDDAMQMGDGPPRVRSNLRMPPPPMFSRLVAPPSYKFRQNPGSKLKKDENGESSRFLQKSRWRGFAPQQFSLRGPSSSKVPLRCQTHVAAERKRCSPQLIARLEELFQERPLWPRAALLNQLTAKERTALELQKAYIPLVCYVIVDGPWRDALSRFGYDPRTDPESRFHQRFSFQSHIKARFMASKPRRNLGSKGDLHVTSGKGKTRGPTEPEEDAEDEEDGEEEEEEEGQTMDRPGRSPPVRQAHNDQDDAVQGDSVDNQTLNEDGDLADDVAPQVGQSSSEAPYDNQSHIFDGQTPTRAPPYISLFDVEDPEVLPLIRSEGPQNLLKKFSMTTGWYTLTTFTKIKDLLGHRFHVLQETGKPANLESCAEVLHAVDTRLRNAAELQARRDAAARGSRGEALDAEEAELLRELEEPGAARKKSKGKGKARARSSARRASTVTGSDEELPFEDDERSVSRREGKATEMSEHESGSRRGRGNGREKGVGKEKGQGRGKAGAVRANSRTSLRRGSRETSRGRSGSPSA